MAKRRTRKEKEKARDHFRISWKPETENTPSEPNVNRQFPKVKFAHTLEKEKQKSAYLLAKGMNIKAIKKNLIKSLLVASLILGIEVMLYLAWKV